MFDVDCQKLSFSSELAQFLQRLLLEMSSNLQPSRGEGKADDVKVTGLVGLSEARAEFLFSRAKQLYELGGNYSVISEKVVTTTLKAISFATENSEHYLFLATVYLDSFDLSSSLHCLRYAVKINPKDPIAIERIGEVLFLIGQEILIEALKLQKMEKHGEIEMISKARAYFEECILYDATKKKFWICKCLCHIHCGHNEILMAQEAINQAVRLDEGKDAETLILRSKILFSQNLISQGEEIRKLTAQFSFSNTLSYTPSVFLLQNPLYVVRITIILIPTNIVSNVLHS